MGLIYYGILIYFPNDWDITHDFNDDQNDLSSWHLITNLLFV